MASTRSILGNPPDTDWVDEVLLRPRYFGELAMHKPFVGRVETILDDVDFAAAGRRIDDVVRTELVPRDGFKNSDLILARMFGVDSFSVHSQSFRNPFTALEVVRLQTKVVVLVARDDEYAVVEDPRHLFPSDDLLNRLALLL